MAVNNAWNGCHSALLRILDQHLTSFINLWGHNCYCRNPQGFVGAGDGYNWHFDAILTNFAHKERCNDNTIFWGRDLVPLVAGAELPYNGQIQILLQGG